MQIVSIEHKPYLGGWGIERDSNTGSGKEGDPRCSGHRELCSEQLKNEKGTYKVLFDSQPQWCGEFL